MGLHGEGGGGVEVVRWMDGWMDREIEGDA